MVLSSQSMQEVEEYRVGGGERETEGRPEKRGKERSGDGGGESVLVRHPTVFVFMMEYVPETQGKIFGLC